MKKLHIFAILLISMAFILGIAKLSFAQDILTDFNPNYIISDAEILNYNSMSASDIQTFLESKGSYLATYNVTDPNTGKIETTAQAIYDRCQANKVSPRFVLVLLQKEQGLGGRSGADRASIELGSRLWLSGQWRLQRALARFLETNQQRHTAILRLYGKLWRLRLPSWPHLHH